MRVYILYLLLYLRMRVYILCLLYLRFTHSIVFIHFMQYDQCFLIRPYCIFDYQMLGDQIAATKLLRPIVVDPIIFTVANITL